MDIIELCRSAWNATRKDHQPAYDDLTESYRNLLTQQAAGAVQGQISDGPFASFDSQVCAATQKEPDELERVVDEPAPKPEPPKPVEPAKAEPIKAKKTAKKLAVAKAATKKVKVIKKAAKKAKK